MKVKSEAKQAVQKKGIVKKAVKSKSAAFVAEAIEHCRLGKVGLKEAEIILHEKPLHVELAEWIASEYYGGVRSVSSSKKAWDVELPTGERIQVKSHSKASSTTAECTTLSKHSQGVTYLFIVLFSLDLYIKEIFFIDIIEAEKMSNVKREITWGKLRNENHSQILKPFKKKFPYLFMS